MQNPKASKRIQDFYRSNPLMISSPFGGVTEVNNALLLNVFDRLGITLAGGRVLDVGCGRGLLHALAKDAGATYTGLDFVPIAQGFPLAAGDAAHLPFADASFDTVLCIDAMEHFPDPVRAATEFRRVLRPGGAWFLSIPNYGNVAGIVKRVYERVGWYERNTWAPFGRWQPQELEQFVTARSVRSVAHEAGFTEARCIGHDGEVGLGLFPWLDHPRMPDAIRYRLQPVFRRVGPAVTRVWPGASLHLFWKFLA